MRQDKNVCKVEILTFHDRCPIIILLRNDFPKRDIVSRDSAMFVHTTSEENNIS